MKSLLKDVFRRVDSEYGDVRIEEMVSTRIVFRGREPIEVLTGSELGGCLRVFRRGNWGVASFNQLEVDLSHLAQETAAQLGLMPARRESVLGLPALNREMHVDPEQDVRAVPLLEKHRLLRHYNDLLLAQPGVSSTRAIYEDRFSRCHFYSSEARYISQERVYAVIDLTATARDGTNVQTYSRSFGKPRGFATLQGQETQVEEIARMAVALLAADKVRAGVYTVVIDPLLAGLFAHEAFGHLAEADLTVNNARLREMTRPGTRYGSEELAIVDDGTLPFEPGSSAFDDEGAPAGKTHLLKAGQVAGLLHNRQTASRLEGHLTGNARALSYRFAPIVRMTNTYFEPRNRTLDELLDGVADGLYVAGSAGGVTDMDSFTFGAQYGRDIRNGKLGAMKRDIVLTGNVFETLKNIDAIGGDLVMQGGMNSCCGKADQSPLPVGMGGPHLRIRNVVVGGV
jgi:TldD protein